MTEGKMSRRNFLKGAVVASAAVAFAPLLSACSAQGDGNGAQDTAQTTSQQVTNEASIAESGVLVAYFSATGNTRSVAKTITHYTNADMFEITPSELYSEEDLDYNDEESRVSQERANGVSTVELVETTPSGFSEYSTVFIGYPIWWGDASWVVNNFVTNNNFEGKTVIPFCTSASSPMGSSGDNLAALADSGEWLEGMRFDGINADESEIQSWISELGLQE